MPNADMFSSDEQVAPAVFGGEATDDHDKETETAETEPPVPAERVFIVPAEAVTPPQSDVTVQLGRTDDNELVLLAFSTPERLAACLGEEQPWVAILRSQLESVQRACEADHLEIDPVRPAE